MYFIEQDKVDILNYIISFSDRNVEDEIRTKASNSIKDISDYRKLFDNMIYILKEKFMPEPKDVTDEEFNEYFNYLITEYSLLGFNEYIDMKYLQNALYLVIKLSGMYYLNNEDIWKKINLTIESLSDCEDNIVKDELYYLVVSIISNYNLTRYDVENTAVILEYCRDIDFSNFNLQKLPQSMFVF